MNVYSIYKRREVAPVADVKHIEDTIFALVAANSEEEAITSFSQEWFDKNFHGNNPRDKKEAIEKLKKILVAFKCNTLECNTNNPKFLFYLDGRYDELIQDDGLNADTYYYKRTGGYVSDGSR